MSDSNYLVVELKNLSIIKGHLKEGEIDPGRNAHYDPENGQMKYFFNQDDSDGRNAQFYLSDDALILKWFSPPGDIIDIDLSMRDKSGEPESRFFPFISNIFKNFDPSELLSELKSYSLKECLDSRSFMSEWGYPILQIARISYLPPERRNTFKKVFEDKIVYEKDRRGKIDKTTWPDIDPDLENLVRSSFDHFYYDRYEVLPEESPKKKTKSEVMKQMKADLKRMIAKEAGVNAGDLIYFFRVLKQQTHDHNERS